MLFCGFLSLSLDRFPPSSFGDLNLYELAPKFCFLICFFVTEETEVICKPSDYQLALGHDDSDVFLTPLDKRIAAIHVSVCCFLAMFGLC